VIRFGEAGCGDQTADPVLDIVDQDFVAEVVVANPLETTGIAVIFKTKFDYLVVPADGDF